MREEIVSGKHGVTAVHSGPGLELHAHLGRKLREMFEGPTGPLPQRLADLLDALAAKDNQRPTVNSKTRNDLLGLVPNLRAFAMSLCGNHERADDLVQETLLKAWGHLDSFQEGTNLRAWLFTILRNSYFSEMRKRRREVEDADGKKAATLSVAPAQQGHVDMQDFRKALDLLPPDQREALVLVGAAGMSYEETAEIAHCAVGTVKSRVNRARLKLANLLGIDGADAFGPDFATEAITGGSVGTKR
jgi:RNA polymerase sigma-70 factor, ECF subfamily